MRPIYRNWLWLLPGVLCLAAAQQTQKTAVSAVPNLIRFTGFFRTAANPPAGPIGATFAIYAEQEGGTALWSEEQNVELDASGNYTVLLGATKNEGVPLELFAPGESRWLQIKLHLPAEVEQPRVLLTSVPYALKAADAATVGGLPPSAFMLAAPVAANPDAARPSGASPRDTTPSASTGTGNYIPIWTDGSGDMGNSVLYQSGTGATAKIGVNTTTPSATLDVKGSGTIRGALTLPLMGTATASTGYKSQPLNLAASVFNSGTSTAVKQTFQWQAEPVGNNTASATGSLNLLYGSGTATPAETGLSVGSSGVINFTSRQTFPGTGSITGVTAGAGLSGGGTSGAVTLSNTGVLGVTAGTGISSSGGQTPTIGINTAIVPQLAAANIFTGNQLVNGNLSATGVVTGSGYQIGSNLFAFGSYANSNAFLGFAGNANTTGAMNTATGAIALPANTSGFQNTAAGFAALQYNNTGYRNTATGGSALQNNTSGSQNTADGYLALLANTTGVNNTANGLGALEANTTGGSNTASGFNALQYNSTGGMNTAIGYDAGPDQNSTNLFNATAIGANAVVSASNALVLGGTGQSAVNVGIGTAAPAYTLDVHGTGNFTGLVTFASGQTFPGTGTITGVTAGTGLSGGGTSGSVTLNLDTTKVPLLNAANIFNGNQTVNGQLISGVATGVAPLVVNSSTQVPNLNASLLGGFSAASFQPAGSYATLGPNNFTGDQTIAGRLVASGTITTQGGSVLPAAGTATASAGYGSRPIDWQASTFNSATSQAVGQDFRWMAEPAGNNTSNPSATLNLLYGAGGATPAETGLSIASNGTVTFNSKQLFPGTGTITGVTAGTGLSGGGVSGIVSLTNTGLLGLTAGTGISSSGGNSPIVSLNTSFTDARYLPLSGGVLAGGLSLPANGLAAGGNQLVLANGNVGIGTAAPAAKLEVNGPVQVDGRLTLMGGNLLSDLGTVIMQASINAPANFSAGQGALNRLTTGIADTAIGFSALQQNTTGSENTAMGASALLDNTEGNNNTGIGNYALSSNITGTDNTATGSVALQKNTSGSENTAYGANALHSNTTAYYNTAIGSFALFSNTANGNTATGYEAMIQNTTGILNTATGYEALSQNTAGISNVAIGATALVGASGSFNIGIGDSAGSNITTGSYNIEIGHVGLSSDDGVIRIGSSANGSTFIAGIRNVSTGISNAVPVLIDSNGQLGTSSSSRRYKEDIHDMGDASSGLMRLRPVTFRYKKPFSDGSKPIQYGLIAEEVAEVYPDLVARGSDGQIETVKYQLLDPMLLNELQRQHSTIQAQQSTIQTQQAQIQSLEARLAKVEAALTGLSATATKR